MSAIETELGPWIERHRWAPPAAALDRLDALIELWLRYAPSMNVTGARDRGGLLEHVCDGLETVLCARKAQVALGITTHGDWVDVGSGGGFPGLVVAAMAQWPITLVEPRAKRAAFLELAARTIDPGSIAVWRCRVGDSTWNQNIAGRINSGVSRHFAIASARAVFAPAEWLEQGVHVIKAREFVVVHAKHALESPNATPLAVVHGTFGPIAAHKGANTGAEQS